MALSRTFTPLTTLAKRSSAYSRSLSTSAVNRERFFVYAPDLTDAGAFKRRLSVRPSHIETARGKHVSGLIKMAGALLTPESVESPTAEKKMIGSTFICEAESIAEVRKYIEGDIYYTAGVWDPERLVILPFAAAKFLTE